MEDLLNILITIVDHKHSGTIILLLALIIVARRYHNGLLMDKKRLREENDALRGTDNLTKKEFEAFTKAHDEVHNSIKGDIGCLKRDVGDLKENSASIKATLGGIERQLYNQKGD